MTYFVFVTGEERTHLYLTLGSHGYVHYIPAWKKLLRELFAVEVVQSPQSSVFAGHEYVQHVRSEWLVGRCIPYSSSLIPEDRDLADAIAFIYKGSIALGAEKHLLSLHKGLDLQVRD